MSENDVKNAQELSPVEVAKRGSRGLRGTVAEVLADDAQPTFAEADKQVLKFHGVYQQDDRDLRQERRKQGLDKAWSLMIRVATPGGTCTAEQYLDLDDLCDTHANGTLKVTTRQAFQLHGVLKGDLKATMRRINDALLTTLSACGDIPRNVMATPAPYANAAYDAVQRMAVDLTADLAPATGAYHEIWLDGEKVHHTDETVLGPNGEVLKKPPHHEPFYGESYLPRKFKIGVGLDGDNSVDAMAYDCALYGLTDGDGVVGYNLVVGGGMGMTHNKPETIARIGSPIAFVPAELAVRAVREVVAIFRDHGERKDRRAARIKYLIEKWGVEKFRAELEARLGVALEDPRPLASTEQLDHLGLHEQGDGRYFYGVFVENGRIVDRDGGAAYKSAFRELVSKHRPRLVLTPMQSVLFGDLTREQAQDVAAILEKHGVARVEDLSNLRRYAMACVALPTCGLSLADGERALPGVIDELEGLFDELGIGDTPLTVRMTGCPNGCARPYNADIGFVGRGPDKYHVFVGGGLRGDRLADLFAADVKKPDIAATLRPLLEKYRDERSADEGLGDFYQRLHGDRARRTVLTGKEEATAPLLNLTVQGAAV